MSRAEAPFPLCNLPLVFAFYSFHLQGFLCIVHRTPLIHLVYFLFCAFSPLMTKTDYSVEPPALTQLFKPWHSLLSSHLWGFFFISLCLSLRNEPCFAMHHSFVSIFSFIHFSIKFLSPQMSFKFFFFFFCSDVMTFLFMLFTVHSFSYYKASCCQEKKKISVNLFAVSALLLHSLVIVLSQSFSKLITVNRLPSVNMDTKWNTPIISKCLAGHFGIRYT